MVSFTYERNLNHNYLIVSDNEIKSPNYKDAMLLQNNISGLLSVEIRRFNQSKLYCYDITGLQLMTTAFGISKLTKFQLQQLLRFILKTVITAGKYLLEENDFVLLPEQIFVRVPENEVKLCYFPGYGKDIREQISGLLEYFMNQIEYEDEDAVVLVYSVYMKSREKGYGIQSLFEAIDNEKSIKKDLSSTNFNNNGNLVNFDDQTRKNSVSRLEDQARKSSVGRLEAQTKKESIDKSEDKRRKDSVSKPDDQERKRSFSRLDDQAKKGRGGNLENQIKAKAEHLFSLIDKISINSVNEPAVNKKEKKSINNGLKEFHRQQGKIETEVEKIYYPIKCYVRFIMIVIVSFFLVIFSIKFKFVYNTFHTSIDITKIFGMIFAVGALNVFIYLKEFSKKNLCSKIIVKADYEDEEHQIIKKPSRTDPINKDISKEDSIIQELDFDYINGEDNTILLCDNRSSIVVLTPSDPVKYKEYIINEVPFYIGKKIGTANARIENPMVSKIHAKVDILDEKYYIYDLNSTNGTFVNGERLPLNGNMQLMNGDMVSFADVTYVFSCSSETKI